MDPYPRPNYFAAALKAYTERPGVTLSQIEGYTGVHLPELSRLRSGRRRISFDTLCRLTDNIEESDAIALVIAFLRDNIPPSLAARIQITADTCRLSEPTSAPLSRFQKAVRWLTDKEADPVVRDWLIGTAELIQAIPPAEHPDDDS